jgi:phosphoglycolate phosphatase
MNLLVDLDGTITEPAPGIIGSVRYALDVLNIAAPPGDDLHWVIGPPLRQMFPKLGVPADQVERAVDLYREKYTGGLMYDAFVHEGIPEALDAMRADGHRLFVCTSKPHVYAAKILERFDVAKHFEAIHGAELDGTRDNKADLIAYILATHALSPSETIMIGDTPYDVEGARRNGLPTIGVTWGHGAERLAAASPAAICNHARELPAAVRALAQATAAT